MCPIAERAQELRAGLYLSPSEHLSLYFFTFPETLELIAIFVWLVFFVLIFNKKKKVFLFSKSSIFRKEHVLITTTV